MYETMAVYPLSWMYYVVFIFLTAFVFLNMMVGVVLEVMSRETSAEEQQHQEDHHQALVEQISQLQQQVQALSDKLDRKD
jgi:voltage-gated sodium channel